MSVPGQVPDRAGASGFPSPADDYVEGRIDLNVVLVPRPLASFVLRISDEALPGDGIGHGDLLVIDRSLEPRPGLMVLAVQEGALLLRRLQRRGDRLWLVASDGASAPIPLPGDGAAELVAAEIWGVVRHAVHQLLPSAGPLALLSRAGPGAGR